MNIQAEGWEVGYLSYLILFFVFFQRSGQIRSYLNYMLISESYQKCCGELVCSCSVEKITFISRETDPFLRDNWHLLNQIKQFNEQDDKHCEAALFFFYWASV